jgi:hypothetical protein
MNGARKMRNLLVIYATNVTFSSSDGAVDYTDRLTAHWDELPKWVKDRYAAMAMMGQIP